MADAERLGRRANFLRGLADLEAATEYEGENLTYGELAQVLGLNTEGETLSTVDLINACMGVNENPVVQALPAEQRIKVISSAAGAIEELFVNRGRNLGGGGGQ